MDKKQIKNKAPKKRRVLHLNLGKALFVLPNLFTLSSVACGFYAITLLSAPLTADTFKICALAIFMAAFFDMFDGRVARMTKTQSAFGVEMDSLADVISFGVAPGLMVYRWGLSELGIWGVLAAFAYVACGAIRLARFNVLAQHHSSPSNYFVGMPIPGAATMVVSMVIFHQSYWGGTVESPRSVALIVLAVSLLMVSSVRYRTFKNLRPSPKVAFGLLLLVAICVTLCLLKGVATAVFTMVSSYFAMGLLEEMVYYKRRRLERQEARKQEAAAKEANATQAEGTAGENN